jgi:hypothetical protein
MTKIEKAKNFLMDKTCNTCISKSLYSNKDRIICLFMDPRKVIKNKTCNNYLAK